MRLGRSGLEVSRLCFGSLTIGPLQGSLPLDRGAALLRQAFSSGVTFVDTAQIYGTYPYIREALRGYHRDGGDVDDVVIATKSYAYSAEGMQDALEEARRELDRDVIDIFLLHEQESEHTLRGHREAFEYLLEAKARGWVRAVGLSTHAVAAVRAAAAMDDVDVIHPLINMEGIGILDGTAAEMLAAIAEAHRAGKGIYGMKVLGGGNLHAKAPEALAWALAQPHLDAIAIGMQSERELEVNLRLFAGKAVSEENWREVQGRGRRLLIEDWCTGCGRCVPACPQGALRVVEEPLEKSRCESEDSGKTTEANEGVPIETGTAGTETGTKAGTKAGTKTGIETGTKTDIETGIKTGIEASTEASTETGNETARDWGEPLPRAVVDPACCLLCGYCSRMCRDFCIKVV
ncbi:aldo/keto reductase [Heliomicrobium gestii]|uniref:aldo/keto reductase n=1 Tax=Heliomicrobium gestii TaxID=2699 RepID=UPI002E2955FD|nr:aldo/keto reductase [Heliomicrobium gestii]MBM7868129.1 aryl-alcohol dehydrogenase-like predicted oxidoreductase [Heliomicrobium gestii]